MTSSAAEVESAYVRGRLHMAIDQCDVITEYDRHVLMAFDNRVENTAVPADDRVT